MTGIELKTILDKWTKPPTHANKSEVFVLYSRVTGKTADRNCLNCAIECFLEMKYIAKEFGEKEIPLQKTKSNKVMHIVNPQLTKYRVKKPFRVFGDPKIYSDENLTDKEVEILIAYNPALRHHFEYLEVHSIIEVSIDEELSEIEQIEEETKPKRGRKKKEVEPEE